MHILYSLHRYIHFRKMPKEAKSKRKIYLQKRREKNQQTHIIIISVLGTRNA